MQLRRKVLWRWTFATHRLSPESECIDYAFNIDRKPPLDRRAEQFKTVALASPLFLVRVTMECGFSLVNRNYCAGAYFRLNGILWTMKLISTSEAARRLNVTPSRVRAMIASGRLKAMRVGIMWLIDPKDLEAVKDRKVGRPRKARKSVKR